jgi:hypothetical protein
MKVSRPGFLAFAHLDPARRGDNSLLLIELLLIEEARMSAGSHGMRKLRILAGGMLAWMVAGCTHGGSQPVFKRVGPLITLRVGVYGSPGYRQGVARGSFATVMCPAWMLHQIADLAGPLGSGKWNVTSAPGGAGNSGGFYLAIPKASAHQ